MNKKLLLSIMLVSLSLTAVASSIANTDSKDIERAIYQKTGSSVSATLWWVHLKKQEELANRMSYKLELTFPQENGELAGTAKTIYLQRIVLLTRAIATNKYLKQYIFKAPITDDFVDLSEGRLQVIIGFLKGQVKPQHVAFVQPFVLSVSLGNTLDTKSELWIDVTNHKVYLMSNNFFTSAQTRYDLHLK